MSKVIIAFLAILIIVVAVLLILVIFFGFSLLIFSRKEKEAGKTPPWVPQEQKGIEHKDLGV